MASTLTGMNNPVKGTSYVPVSSIRLTILRLQVNQHTKWTVSVLLLRTTIFPILYWKWRRLFFQHSDVIKATIPNPSGRFTASCSERSDNSRDLGCPSVASHSAQYMVEQPPPILSAPFMELRSFGTLFRFAFTQWPVCSIQYKYLNIVSCSKGKVIGFLTR